MQTTNDYSLPHESGSIFTNSQYTQSGQGINIYSPCEEVVFR